MILQARTMRSKLRSVFKVWNFETGDCITLMGHQQSIWSICHSRSLDILFSCSLDETIKLWDINTGECIRTLTIPSPYTEMNITGITGLTSATKETLIALGAFINPSPN